MIEAMHERGFAMNDQIQVGQWRGGLYFFDTGKADLADKNSKLNDLDSLRWLYRESGHKMSEGEVADLTEKMDDFVYSGCREKDIEKYGGIENYRLKMAQTYFAIKRSLKAGNDHGFFDLETIDDDFKHALESL